MSPLVTSERPSRRWQAVCAALAVGLLICAPGAEAQTLDLKRDVQAGGPTPCGAVAVPEAGLVTEGDREEAARLASSATQASIVGDHAGARDLLLRATRLDPEAADVAYLLGRAYEELGNHPAAIRELCRYLALDPEAPDVGDVTARLAALDAPEGPVLSPGAERLFRNGVTQFDLGRLADARVAFSGTIDQAPEHAAAYYNRAAVSVAMDRGEEAIADLEAYLEREPEAEDRVQVEAVLQALRNPVRRYSPGTAMATSLFLPGSGQMYSGRSLVGLVFLSAAAGSVLFGELSDRTEVVCRVTPVDGPCATVDILSQTTEQPYRTAGYAAAGAIAIVAAIDAYRGARAQNQGLGGGVTVRGAPGVSLAGPSVSRGPGGSMIVTLLGLRF